MYNLFNTLAQLSINQDDRFNSALRNALYAFAWTILGMIIFSVVISIAMRLFSALTPGIDELAELRNGNVSVALVMFAYLLSVSAIVAALVLAS